MQPPEGRLADLVKLAATGTRLKFVFFWGHRPARPGLVDAACLSQWWPAPFEVDGARYPTAEHWMMAQKARLFGDGDALKKVLRAPHPGAAKACGREVRGFSEQEWEANRYEIVVTGNLAKFSQHDDLRRYLASTGQRILVEASPVDRIWGIGLAATDDRASSPSRWRGQNLLGFGLMEVREQIG